ncbi:hypothetical protein HNR60_002321 [Rhodopseudomonas rhenobacensis]|uniref:Uncharacterized protein n=1 Tax=Rhodopseudomonas rhenobacensis TaxID=87461 RepID=A0A7W7Z424_9BRAD|nr:hypothetical protein [Rhodopseudomonas rhenobacensis]MBB5047564.1 hypothetical protein [Rhodopseudomonas rhenobacensis]
MQPYVRDENLKRYRKALSEAETIEHRVIFSALIANLECFEPVVRLPEPQPNENFKQVA